MVLHLNKDTPQGVLRGLQRDHWAVVQKGRFGGYVVVLEASYQRVPRSVVNYVEQTWVMPTNIQLASRAYSGKTQEIDLGFGRIGGETSNTVVMAGPCSVETASQIDKCARFLKELPVRVLRAGCYKPRTSPYAFQGLGEKGLGLLAEMRTRYGCRVITEVKDATHVEAVIAESDFVQVGAKAMYDQGILRACGRTQKPVLIKRGFGTTLQEFVQAAEFVLSLGNPNVILCERGIRTFESKTRFTLDLCGVAYLKHHTRLPVVVDPSHAMGHAYGVADLTRAALAMGVDGLLVEVHPHPEKAWSDAAQQLDFEAFKDLYASLKPIAEATQRQLI